MKKLFGVANIGTGLYKSKIDNKKTIQYTTWYHMLERCYDKKRLDKQPTYIKCVVDKEWFDFQNFAEWFDENYTEGFALDKDILVKNNKVYSKSTCIFVPTEINSLFTRSQKTRGLYPIGVKIKKDKFEAQIQKNKIKFYLGIFDTKEEAFEAYKLAKEDFIKEKAEQYKNRLTKIAYKALMEYKVEIND